MTVFQKKNYMKKWDSQKIGETLLDIGKNKLHRTYGSNKILR